ncbi:MAG: hypothetical protein IJQ39_11910 [Thermoguttaceae bacterium]|nr:hypothetical protein [Thermoguttaceae bacterium]
MDNSPIRIAIVGMTGAGKTVLISTLAMKMSQMADQGVFLAPMGENRRQTLRYVQENWQTLNSGKWPPSTPAGELIHLEWELTTKTNSATVRFADCAGQDVHAIFSQERFDYGALTPDQKYVFDYLRSANVLIFLINMEDVLGRSPKQALENSLDIDQMFYVLNQKANFPRKTALVLSQFDKYRDELRERYNNNLLEYLQANFPQLHGRYIQNPNFAVIPVAAVETTQTIIENGMTKKVPAENFSSFNLKKLISWIASAVDELAPLMAQVDIPSITSSVDNTSDESPSTDKTSDEGISFVDTYTIDDASQIESTIPVESFEGATLIFPADSDVDASPQNVDVCPQDVEAPPRNVEVIHQKKSYAFLWLGIILFCAFISGLVIYYHIAKNEDYESPAQRFGKFWIFVSGVSLALYCCSVVRIILEKNFIKKLQNEADASKHIQIGNSLRAKMHVDYLAASGLLFYGIYTACVTVFQIVPYLYILPLGILIYMYYSMSMEVYKERISEMIHLQRRIEFFNAAGAIFGGFLLATAMLYGMFMCFGLNVTESMVAVNVVFIIILIMVGIGFIGKQNKNQNQ